MPDPHAACPSCGYDLAGLTTSGLPATCPECGADLPRDLLTVRRRFGPQFPAALCLMVAPAVLLWSSWRVLHMVTRAGTMDAVISMLPFAAVLWAFAAPPIIALRRERHFALPPRITVAETVTAWLAQIIIAAGIIGALQLAKP